MEISNKTLAWLVVAAIVVSIFGTIFSLQKLNSNSFGSGYASSNDTGTASVNVGQSVVLRYDTATVDFGGGSVDSSGGYNNCTLSMNSTAGGTGIATIYAAGCVGFNAANAAGDTFVLENAGTSYLNVTLNFSANASAFVGGNNSLSYFRYAVANNETGSCVSGGLSNTSWTNVISNTLINVCNNLSWLTGSDSLRISINVSIPENAQGNKTVSIIAQGTGL